MPFWIVRAKMERVMKLTSNGTRTPNQWRFESGSWCSGRELGALGMDFGALRAEHGALRVDLGALGIDLGALGMDLGALGMDLRALGMDLGSPVANLGALRVNRGALGMDLGALGLNPAPVGSPGDRNRVSGFKTRSMGPIVSRAPSCLARQRSPPGVTPDTPRQGDVLYEHKRTPLSCAVGFSGP